MTAASGKPGTDWLSTEATTLPRRRTGRARARVAATAAALFAVSFLVWRATGQVAPSHAPLSFHLDEVTPAQSGMSFVHESGSFAPFFDNVKPFMRAVSASACTADVDNDGDLDVYFTTAGDGARNVLFENDGALHFHDAGVHALDGDNGRDGFSSDCVFADVDNDGWPDLFVGTVGQSPHLFHNDLGRGFHELLDAGIPDYMNGFAVSFVDVDNDGDLDLLFASYFAERYQAEDIAARPRVHPWRVPDDDNAGRMMPNNWGNADNGGEKHLLLNDGSGHFVAQDLATWGLAETRFTFDIGTADIDNDGFPEIYVTNVFHPVLPEGNILWKNSPGDAHHRRTFQNIAADVGAKDGGWGWGAKLVDLDLDGDTDLVETNGYISQSPTRDYWYALSRLVAGDRRLIVDTRKWPPFEDRSMSGHQVSHVFVWDGNRFHDRADDAGVTRSFDGRGVLIGDFDVDGRPDVLLVAQGAPYFLGHNVFRATPESTAPPHWAGVVVAGDGVRVNRAGVGVKVEIRASDALAPQAPKPLFREVSAGNGMSAQSMPWIIAGLGAYSGAVDVVVRWTDGTQTTERALASDRYHTIRYGAPAAGAP